MGVKLFRKAQQEESPQELAPPEASKSYLIDYDVYVMSKQEKSKYILLAAGGLFVISFIFFRNIFISIIFSFGAFLYPKYKVKELIEKRKRDLNLQFKDALYSLSSSLSAGKSLESSFQAALNDLRILFQDEDTYIIKEFEYICRRIEMNEPVERALLDFSARSHLEDIKNFADVMVICKRTGGNLVEVVKNTSNIISDKIQIGEEIEMLLARQKFEQKILNVMPVVFIGLITFGGSGYTDPLYSSIKGYLLMAVALGILAVSYYVSKKIMDIKV